MAYEDFTTYTKVDEGADITVMSTTKVVWANLQSRWFKGYVYKDKGVNYFDGDFTHKLEIQFENVEDFQRVCHWVVANAIGDAYQLVNASEDFYDFLVYDNTERIFLHIYENGSIGSSDSWDAPGPQPSTTYFITIVRDDDGGANNTGRLTAYIRTGSHSGALQDTLVADCSAGEQNDFRYIYGASTYDNNAIAYETDGFTQNLDLGEAAPPPVSKALVFVVAS